MADATAMPMTSASPRKLSEHSVQLASPRVRYQESGGRSKDIFPIP
jgi:hypothetical protein